MPILEQRGVFWWHDEPVPDHLLAPDSHVAGLCRIEDDGRTILELDGYLTNPHGPMAAMVAGGPVDKSIQGLLKESGERILLCDLARRGGRFSTNGISYERFVAMDALVDRTMFPRDDQALKFDVLEIPLSGFEEWLQLGAIKVTQAEKKISASYEMPDDLVYTSDDGSLSIVFDVNSTPSGMLATYALAIKESALLRLRLNEAKALSDLKFQYGMVEDLLKVLTGSDYSLEWPRVPLTEGSTCRWYFTRLKSKDPIAAAAPEYYNTITRFPELRETFGSIWSRWKAKREEFGPGFYLYLGTRRGMALYAEHSFVNLIWGLEAFHRKKNATVESDALKKKVERIIGQVESAKDKKWLRRKLRDAHEPSLSERLFDVFKALPIDLDESRLRAFSEACARLRNDISHFGERPHGGPYSEFIRELERKSAALSTLYHTLLLNEIGIDAAILKRWLYESFGSLPIKLHFAEAGLVDPSVLRASAGSPA